jgi:tetratricopeptide (TPR) repeat protein
MTLSRTPLLAAPLAFVAMLAILVIALGHAGGGRAAADPARMRLGAPDAPRPGASTDERIRALQAAVRAHPRSAGGYVLLAGAYRQKVRETGDGAYYAKAGGLLHRALALAPGDAGALTERAALELSRHDFRAGLRDALAARRAAPDVAKPFGALVDALVELGRYGPAARALQRMVDRRPDLAAYARVSYFRELHGDIPGAIVAMRLAVSAGGGVPENTAYAQALLGDLELARGRRATAAAAYRQALGLVPGHPAAEAGLARVQVARGDLDGAIRRLSRLVGRLPFPQYVVALGEAELAAGRAAAAARHLALVPVEQRLLAARGVNTDAELALFEADHGSPRRAVAPARSAWAAAPSVRSADALGWALTRSGDARSGVRWARRALRLGSRDAMFLYHAGMAARAAGERSAARRWLAGALAGNRRFSPVYGPRAARALAEVTS